MNNNAHHLEPQNNIVEEVSPTDPRAVNAGASHSRATGKHKQTKHENVLVEYRLVPPYPKRLQKENQDVRFRKFLDVLKQLHIDIPLVEALEQMPSQVRFLKDILTNKRMLGEFETVALIKKCSTILIRKIP